MLLPGTRALPLSLAAGPCTADGRTCQVRPSCVVHCEDEATAVKVTAKGTRPAFAGRLGLHHDTAPSDDDTGAPYARQFPHTQPRPLDARRNERYRYPRFPIPTSPEPSCASGRLPPSPSTAPST